MEGVPGSCGFPSAPWAQSLESNRRNSHCRKHVPKAQAHVVFPPAMLRLTPFLACWTVLWISLLFAISLTIRMLFSDVHGYLSLLILLTYFLAILSSLSRAGQNENIAPFYFPRAACSVCMRRTVVFLRVKYKLVQLGLCLPLPLKPLLQFAGVCLISLSAIRCDILTPCHNFIP